MSRRYSLKNERRSIETGLDERTVEIGTTIQWWRHSLDTSTPGSVYDYGGRDWAAPRTVRVLSAVRTEGPQGTTETGLYTTDQLHVVVSIAEIRRHGWPDITTDTQKFLRDRILYEGVVFTIINVQIRGQVGNDIDLIVGITAAEVDPSELVNDADFVQYAV